MFLALFAAGCRSAGPAEEALVQARLGTEATRAGLYREAYFRFERAVALDPGNARFLNDLAILSEALGRFEEAAAHYAHALELAPADKRIRENYEKLQAYLAPDRPPDPAR
jgi:Flp pilus assembly protein TadD